MRLTRSDALASQWAETPVTSLDLALVGCTASLGGRRTEGSKFAKWCHDGPVLLTAPRLAILVIPEWVLRMAWAGRPCRVPEKIVRALLKLVHHRLIEGALRFRGAVPCCHPRPSELLVVSGEAEDLGACALTETRDSVLQEEPDDAVGVDRV